MQAWLQQHAPATMAAHDKAAWLLLRRQVVASRPDWAHDLSALRRETIRLALLDAGDDPALADPAFEVFFAERQRVDLFDDVLPALGRLAARWPVVALTNGNADVQRVPGLGRHFHAAVSARDLGLAKPAPQAFAAACARARRAARCHAARGRRPRAGCGRRPDCRPAGRLGAPRRRARHRYARRPAAACGGHAGRAGRPAGRLIGAEGPGTGAVFTAAGHAAAKRPPYTGPSSSG